MTTGGSEYVIAYNSQSFATVKSTPSVICIKASKMNKEYTSEKVMPKCIHSLWEIEIGLLKLISGEENSEYFELDLLSNQLKINLTFLFSSFNQVLDVKGDTSSYLHL